MLLGRYSKRLLGVVEFRRQGALFDVVEAQALANEFEAAADGERGGSQNYGVELFEKPLAQDLADVDGRGGEKHTFVAAFEPVDIIFFVGFEQEGQFLAQLKAAPRDAQSIPRAFAVMAANSVSRPFSAVSKES